jgi:hypothetical protein
MFEIHQARRETLSLDQLVVGRLRTNYAPRNRNLQAISSAPVNSPLPAALKRPQRLVTDFDAAFCQQVLDIPQAQRKAGIHHHNKADDLGRRVEIPE